MSGLLGAHDPLLGQGTLPPLAGRGVDGGAQVGQGGGERAAGGLQGHGGGGGLGQQAGGVLAGALDGGQGVLDSVSRRGGW